MNDDELKTRCLNLRLAGAPLEQIAEKFDITVDTVAEFVAGGLAGVMNEDTAAAAALEIARLDALLAPVWRSAARGEEKAVDRAVKIITQRASARDRLQQALSSGGGPAGGGVSFEERLAQVKLKAVD